MSWLSKTQQHTTALNIDISFIHIERNVKKKTTMSSRTGTNMLTYTLNINPSFNTLTII